MFKFTGELTTVIPNRVAHSPHAPETTWPSLLPEAGAALHRHSCATIYGWPTPQNHAALDCFSNQIPNPFSLFCISRSLPASFFSLLFNW